MISVTAIVEEKENYNESIINEGKLCKDKLIKLRFPEDVLDYLEERMPDLVNAVCLDPWCKILYVDTDSRICKINLPGYGTWSVTPEEIEQIQK